MISKDRRCSLLPSFCAFSDELIPAKVIRPSLVARFASDCTESSSRDSSTSTALLISARSETSRTDCEFS